MVEWRLPPGSAFATAIFVGLGCGGSLPVDLPDAGTALSQASPGLGDDAPGAAGGILDHWDHGFNSLYSAPDLPGGHSGWHPGNSFFDLRNDSRLLLRQGRRLLLRRTASHPSVEARRSKACADVADR